MAVNVTWFPYSMDAEVIMITQKKLPHKHFLHHLILRSIGELAECVGWAALADKHQLHFSLHDCAISVVAFLIRYRRLFPCEN